MNKIKINNNLKYLIFCFLVLGLTGCNRVAKNRLGCLLEKEQEKSSITHQNESNADVTDLCKKAFLGEIDKFFCKVFKDFFMYIFDFGFDMPNCSSDSMDTRMPQMMAAFMLYMADPVVKSFFKDHAAELRKALYDFVSNPDDFINRLIASCETVSKASDSSAGAAINNNVNLMEPTKKLYLRIMDNYTAKLLSCFFMYIFDFGFDMPSCSSDSMDTRMPQMMAAFMLYMADPVVKLFLKQEAAKLRKLFYAYLPHPDFIHLITKAFKASSVVYSGAVAGARLGASITASVGQYTFMGLRLFANN
ncbi:hypothetical protein [Cardinium endosymbiont of Nabis limbatus]|uniref:hypothetical protein n=1 Tax=Cardinium endosymbiont of Nabis limbatus TaxID=3066217 RepID=UPI003AF33C92